MIATTLYSSQCMLGESPLWHARRNCFYWVDINRCILYEMSWQIRKTKQWQFDKPLSLVVETSADELLIALGTSIFSFNPDDESLNPIVNLEPDMRAHRCNDGAADVKGRLWIGTTHLDHEFEKGNLYSIEKSCKPAIKIPHVTISNGIVWSLDNGRMYFIDSPTQRIDAYCYDERTAEIKFERTVINIPISMGTPDGMTIDSGGMLWIAHWGGYGVYQWDPSTGECLNKIEVPAPHVTSCRFAGEKLDELVITTAQKNMSEASLREFPESGNLFVAKPGCIGVHGNRAVF